MMREKGVLDDVNVITEENIQIEKESEVEKTAEQIIGNPIKPQIVETDSPEVDENQQIEENIDEDRKLLNIAELKEVFNECKGVMDKGKTKIGKEVFDIDCGQNWTSKFLKLLGSKYILPKSIK